MEVPMQVSSTREWLNSEHALSCGLVEERVDPQVGPVKEMGPVVWLQRAVVPRTDSDRERAKKIRPRAPVDGVEAGIRKALASRCSCLGPVQCHRRSLYWGELGSSRGRGGQG